MIATLVDNTTEIYDRSFLELNIDEDILESLKNDAFRNALFYESLKREKIDNSCYLYLLITSNFFSKYNFLKYENSKSLNALLKEYLNFRFLSSQKNPMNVTNLDKLLLQISSPRFNNSMEVDHLFPTNGVKISKSLDRYLNLNHIGNLCYLSKRNNQKKYNKLPKEFISYLTLQDEQELLQEFLLQSFGDDLHLEKLFGQIDTVSSFNNFLIIRSKLIIENILKAVTGC